MGTTEQRQAQKCHALDGKHARDRGELEVASRDEPAFLLADGEPATSVNLVRSTGQTKRLVFTQEWPTTIRVTKVILALSNHGSRCLLIPPFLPRSLESQPCQRTQRTPNRPRRNVANGSAPTRSSCARTRSCCAALRPGSPPTSGGRCPAAASSSASTRRTRSSARSTRRPDWRGSWGTGPSCCTVGRIGPRSSSTPYVSSSTPGCPRTRHRRGWSRWTGRSSIRPTRRRYCRYGSAAPGGQWHRARTVAARRRRRRWRVPPVPRRH